VGRWTLILHGFDNLFTNRRARVATVVAIDKSEFKARSLTHGRFQKLRKCPESSFVDSSERRLRLEKSNVISDRFVERRNYWNVTAKTYDQISPDILIGQTQRRAVWRQVERVFQQGPT
jgi:hypothetical protein